MSKLKNKINKLIFEIKRKANLITEDEVQNFIMKWAEENSKCIECNEGNYMTVEGDERLVFHFDDVDISRSVKLFEYKCDKCGDVCVPGHLILKNEMQIREARAKALKTLQDTY